MKITYIIHLEDDYSIDDIVYWTELEMKNNI